MDASSVVQINRTQIKGKTILITGASDGIGRATALALAQMGARLILHGRNLAKCQATLDRIAKQNPGAQVEILLADLADLTQVRAMADDILQRYQRLDVLINNAGAVFFHRQLSSDGYEKTLAVNHLSHFLLTGLLMPRLKETAINHNEARIIVVASTSHSGNTINFDDLQMEKNYRAMRAYGVSKMANVLHAFELARRLEGTGVSANALHPGFVASNIAANNSLLIVLALRILGPFFALSPAQGAQTSVYLASSPEVAGASGGYYVKSKPIMADPIAYNREMAKRLWQASEELVNCEF